MVDGSRICAIKTHYYSQFAELGSKLLANVIREIENYLKSGRLRMID